MNSRTLNFLIAFAAAAVISALLFLFIASLILPPEKNTVSLSDALAFLFANDSSDVLLPDENEATAAKNNNISVLLTGLDYRPDEFDDYRQDTLADNGQNDWLGENTRRIEADFIAVVCVNTDNKTISVISIPEDTVCEISDAAYTLKVAYADLGEDYFGKLISSLTGVEFDYRLSVSISDIGDVVEAAGNVTVSVPCNMYLENDQYTSSPKAKDAVLLLTEGEQYITRNNIVWLLSFDDYGNGGQRSQTILSFADALMSRFCTLENLLHVDEIYRALSKSVKTDLTADDLHQHISVLLSYPSYTIRTQTYPGSYTSDGSRFLPDRETALDLFYKYR